MSDLESNNQPQNQLSKATQDAMQDLLQQQRNLVNLQQKTNQQHRELQREIESYDKDKTKLAQLKGDAEVKERIRNEFINFIHEHQCVSIDDAISIFNGATRRVLHNMNIVTDVDVLDAIDYERALAKHEIKQNWRNGGDFRGQMAYFRMIADNDELVKLNARQDKQNRKGASENMFDVVVVSTKEQADQVLENQRRLLEGSDDDDE